MEFKILITLLFVFALTSMSFAEIPPFVNRLYPPQDSKDVPLNTSIWLYGPTLSYEAKNPEGFALKDSEGKSVPIKVEKYPVEDLSKVKMSIDRSRGWVGPSGYRYFIKVTPESNLKPMTKYSFSYQIDGPVNPLVFTTGKKVDEELPYSVSISKVENKIDGKNFENKPNKFTLVTFDSTPAKGKEPLLVEILVGDDEKSAKAESFVLWNPNGKITGQLWGHTKGKVFAVPVDMCGNRGKISKGIKP